MRFGSKKEEKRNWQFCFIKTFFSNLMKNSWVVPSTLIPLPSLSLFSPPTRQDFQVFAFVSVFLVLIYFYFWKNQFLLFFSNFDWLNFSPEKKFYFAYIIYLIFKKNIPRLLLKASTRSVELFYLQNARI